MTLVKQLVNLFTNFINNHTDDDDTCPSRENEIEKLFDDPEDYFNNEIEYLIDDTDIDFSDITQEIKEEVLIELLDIFEDH
jgi:hypothetical protein